MSRRLRDKYRRRHVITLPGILGGAFDEISEEKLLKVFACNALDVGTVIYVEAKTQGQSAWSRLDTLSTSKREAVIDVSLYDQIRYNVFTFGGNPATIEAVSAVDSDQNVINKDKDGNDALRVLEAIPLEGDSVKGLLNSLVTMQFWALTNYDTSLIDFVVEADGGPIVDNEGNFVVI